MVNTEIRLIIFFAAKDGQTLYSQQKQCPLVDVTGDGSKAQYCKECWLGTWNVRFMNQSKLKVGKQVMAKVNTNILEISDYNGLEWVNLIQMTIISTTVGKNPLEKTE